MISYQVWLKSDEPYISEGGGGCNNLHRTAYVPLNSSLPLILAKTFRTCHLPRGLGKLSKLGDGGLCNPVSLKFGYLKQLRTSNY